MNHDPIRDGGSKIALPAQPSPWVVRFAPLIRPGGCVLDVACGSGRHARYLADRGWEVEAVDADAEAIAALAGVPRINTLLADLENGPWPYLGRRFDAVVVTHYLHRPLFRLFVESMSDSAVLIYETFMVGNERFGRPSRPDFLLRPGELLDWLTGRLAIVAFEQGMVEEPKAAVVQRICAVKGTDAAHVRLP